MIQKVYRLEGQILEPGTSPYQFGISLSAPNEEHVRAAFKHIFPMAELLSVAQTGILAGTDSRSVGDRG